MPLLLAKCGESNTIKKVGGNPDIRKFLENLGFVVGSNITVVSENNGSIIVNVKQSRVAIGRDMASKIII